MEKHLFNFAHIPQWPLDGLQNEKQLSSFLKEMQMDGVEMMVYDSDLDNSSYRCQTIGAHLQYWPCWMPLYERNEEQLNKLYHTKAARQSYYGALNYEDWLENVKTNIRAALKLEPEYLVWHVADSTIAEAFSFKFRHSNKEVLAAAVEVAKVMLEEIPHNVKLLFENLWWPGLTLTEPKEVEYFLDQLANYNVGIMLDTGHLLNTDLTATTEAEAIEVLLAKVKELGYLKEQIQGLHLNLSLSAAYRKNCHRCCGEIFTSEQIMEHIRAIDQHRGFSNPSLARMRELIEPKYINHELYFNNINELRLLLQKQLKAWGK